MSSPSRSVREGIVVGLIAYVAVAAFYALFDVLAARGVLYTLNLLGRAVFRGLRDPAILQLPIPPDLAAMVLYNGLHLVVSLAIGLTVTWLATVPERRPQHARVAGLIIMGGFVATIVAVGLLSTPIRAVLPWWSIMVANSLAVVLAGGYLLRRHPGIWRALLPLGG